MRLAEVVEISACQGGHGLQEEEEEAVNDGEAEAFALNGHDAGGSSAGAG